MQRSSQGMAESRPAAQAAGNLDWQRCPSRPTVQARVSNLFWPFWQALGAGAASTSEPSSTEPTRKNIGDRNSGRRLPAIRDGLCGAGHDADRRAVSVGLSRTQLCPRSSRRKDTSGDHIILSDRKEGASHSRPDWSHHKWGLAGRRCQQSLCTERGNTQPGDPCYTCGLSLPLAWPRHQPRL